MYRATTPLEVCAKQAKRQLSRYPDTVPVVVEPDSQFFTRLSAAAAEKAREALSCPRFAPPKNWTVAQFYGRLRSRMSLPPQYAMFLFVSREREDNMLPCSSSTMGELYAEHAEPETGILWVTLALEKTFG